MKHPNELRGTSGKIHDESSLRLVPEQESPTDKWASAESEYSKSSTNRKL